MPNIFRSVSSPDDWQALLADPVKQWKTGYSARTTAHAWQSAEPGFPPEVGDLLGPNAELQLAIVEHKVPLPGGSRESQCDVFALACESGQNIALAVEAKVNEPFGPTIGEWYASPSEGKTVRLKAICDWLNLSFPPPTELRYQLFHRTAAAIVEARRFNRPVAAMIVHSFSEDGHWFDDYAAFAAYLGMDATIGKSDTKTLSCGLTLLLGWAKGDPKFLSC